MSTHNFFKKTVQATIASGASVSGSLEAMDSALIGFVMPAVWNTAALNIEVSMDNATWATVVYDDNGLAVSSWATPVAAAAYAVDALSMLPWRYVRFRSGTSGSPANQGADRLITAVMRPLA